MKVDELRRELDALSGPDPALGLGRNAVRRNVRRRRTMSAVTALIALLAVVTTSAVVVNSRSDHNGASVVAGQAPAGHRHTSERFGFSVVIPDGWTYDDHTGETNVKPVLFSAQSDTRKAPPANNCAGWKSGPDVYIRVQEVGHQEPPADPEMWNFQRPEHFGAWPDVLFPCPDAVGVGITFNDQGRGFTAVLVHRRDAPRELIEDAVAALDSFTVARDR